jgi:diguanylate cyclase (GGDEF)-like protein
MGNMASNAIVSHSHGQRRVALHSAVFAVCALAVHLWLSLRFPEAAWITPVAWSLFFAAAIAAALLHIPRSAPELRWKWALLVGSFTLMIGSMLCILYAEYGIPGSPSALWLNDLFRSWRLLALLLAVCTPEETERSLNRRLDMGQALLIAVIFFVLFTPSFVHRGYLPFAKPDARLVNEYNDTQAILLALLTLLAVFTAKTAESRLFHTVLAVFLWVGVPASIYTNEFVNNLWIMPPASAPHVVGDFAPLAFVFALQLLRDRLPPRDPSPPLVFVRLGASAFLPFFALLAGMLAVADRHVVFGCACALIAMILYGVRSTYGQYQLLASQTHLQGANRRLELLSTTDPLTGLYNRRWFDDRFSIEWKRAHRAKSPISLLLIDIDHFKLYNDTLGHASGDECLQAVATLIAEQINRCTDAAVRYGGEEFVVMLPDTGCDGSRGVADKVLAALEERPIPHAASPFGRVTVSIGGATAHRHDPNSPAEQLLLLADQALYRAKEEGRNRIQIAPAEPVGSMQLS